MVAVHAQMSALLAQLASSQLQAASEAGTIATVQTQMAELQVTAQQQAASRAASMSAVHAQMAGLQAVLLPCPVLAPGAPRPPSLIVSGISPVPVTGTPLSQTVLAAALQSARMPTAVLPSESGAGPVMPSPVAWPSDAVPGTAPASLLLQGRRVGTLPAAAVAATAAVVRRRVRQPTDDESLCVVCMDAARSITLLPCSHHVLCVGCCASVRTANDECPMCRAPIQDTCAA